MCCYDKAITLPDDLTAAIEQTYDEAREFAEATVAMREALEKAKEKMERDEAKAEREADLRLVREPSFPRLLREPNTQLEEDNPDLHTAFQALTRLAEPGITLVCVHDDFGTLYLEPGDRSTRVDPYHPDNETARKLARYTVTVQDYRVVKFFSAAEQLSKTFPTAWLKIAALRYHRLAIFDNDGNCTMEGTPYTLHLTRELGVEIK
jgi:CRISPR-associated endonuclease/helicase Cas3